MLVPCGPVGPPAPVNSGVRPLAQAMSKHIVLATLAAVYLLPNPSALAATVEVEPAFVKSFRECFTYRGAPQQAPEVAQLPPAQELSKEWGINDAGAVADAFIHSLVVHTKSNSAYVVQSGGLSGTQRIFGPLPLKAPCH
jgi:hypothetical protein